jgi:MSHA biogenesis protein MshJ
MTQWLRDLMDRYDQLSLRERVMVLGAALLLLTLLWDSLLMAPLEREGKRRLMQVQALRAEVSGLEQSVEAIVGQGAADPDRASRDAIDKLRQEIATLDTELAGATSGLIAPKEMAQVLEQLLKRTSRLTLHALRTLPPEAVIAPPAGATGAAGAEAPARTDQAQIYRHGVELELDGTYLETLSFLQAVETLPWRFFWDRIDFRVVDHPQGRVKLVLYTLGLQEGWIGV